MKIVNKLVFKNVNSKFLVFKIVNCKLLNCKLKNHGNI